MVLAEHTSVPLSDDIRLTNKNSENLHAELLLLLSAHEKAGASDYEDALKFASDFFRAAGIADGDVALSDGSGLSRKDLVTPRAVVQLLRYAAAQPWGELYRSTLPVAGEDGTLSDRMKNTPAADARLRKNGNHRPRQCALGLRDDTSRRAPLVFDPWKQQQSPRAGREQSHRCDLRGDGRGVGPGAADEEKEVKEEASRRRALVAQPLLAVWVLRSSIVYEFVKVEKTAQPRVAVLLKPTEALWVAASAATFSMAAIAAFRP